MTITLPPKSPLRCRLHVHKWSGFYLDYVLHSGEYPWEDWQHVCTRLVKTCTLCGYTRTGLRHRACYGLWVVKLKKQPYSPKPSEIEAAGTTLLDEE